MSRQNTGKSRGEKGKWLKGAPSPNPGGRPKADHDLVMLCRSHTVDAIKTLYSIMQNDEAKDQARVKAAEVLLDRGWGTAPQKIEIAGDLSIKRIVLEDR